MFARRFGWGKLVASLVLGLGLLLLGRSALAQQGQYQGDELCGACHDGVYADYKQHGHLWIEVATGGLKPTDAGFPQWADANGNALTDAEGNVIGLPDPTAVFVANYLGDPNDKDASGNPKSKWALVKTDGTPFTVGDATTGKFITAVASLSPAQVLVAKRMQWSDVRTVLGNFKESASGEFVTSAGQTVSVGGIFDQGGTIANMSLYSKRCFHCHNPTGFSSTPTADDPKTMYGIDPALWVNQLKSGSTVVATYPIGAPAMADGNRLMGVQCEHCHGALQPHGFSAAGGGMVIDRLMCVNCHSSTDPTDPMVALDVSPNVDANGKATWDTNKRIPFSPTADGKTGVFTNHHSQGDEFRRSPHKNAMNKTGEKQGCVLCHDPHKSVWHDQGGVKFAEAGEEESTGMMCAGCHQDSNADYPAATKVRLRGGMADVLVCTDCHMPEKSGGSASSGVATSPNGSLMTHLFKINPTALKATDNMSNELSTPWATTKANYWKSTNLDGDSFLTLDMVCTNCHSNMTIDQMAKSAQTIHRKPGLIDLTANNDETLQFVQKAEKVSVDFSVVAGKKAGKNATVYVLCQGPKGWQSWNGSAWKAGYFPWKKNVKLANMPRTNVLNARLKPGFYTYFVCIDLKDGLKNYDSVPVWVGQ